MMRSGENRDFARAGTSMTYALRHVAAAFAWLRVVAHRFTRRVDHYHEDPGMIAPYPYRQWSDISRTDRFVCIQPMSGYRNVQQEDDGYAIYLPPDADEEALGRALFDCLDRSRFLEPPGHREFFNWERYVPLYKNWQKDFMHRYGYKTKREAYKNMDWCRAMRMEGKISFEPHKRDKPEYFIDLPPERTVVIPATTDPIAVGAALRQGLDRCEPRGEED
ncbi:MAG: DUF1436 family protein [Bradyrhizobium sp.]|nr:MAG: DUF1436 family protein [Bradyrhizobium sp.]